MKIKIGSFLSEEIINDDVQQTVDRQTMDLAMRFLLHKTHTILLDCFYADRTNANCDDRRQEKKIRNDLMGGHRNEIAGNVCFVATRIQIGKTRMIYLIDDIGRCYICLVVNIIRFPIFGLCRRIRFYFII